MRALALALAGTWLAQANAQGHEHLAAQPDKPGAALIRIVINPEARISVSRSGELPSTVSCGSAVTLPVEIVNQGFVTTPLDASLVDGAPAGIAVEFPLEPLKGTARELRVLRVTLTKPGLWDVTIVFRAKVAIPDRGGHDRVNLLLRCS